MGCWSAPFKTEQAEALREAMKKPLDGDTATHVLYHVVGDDELYDRIDDLVGRDEGEDVRVTVMVFLQDWFGDNGDNTEVRESWQWKDPFDVDALEIIKEMLTAWNTDKTFPS